MEKGGEEEGERGQLEGGRQVREIKGRGRSRQKKIQSEEAKVSRAGNQGVRSFGEGRRKASRTTAGEREEMEQERAGESHDSISTSDWEEQDQQITLGTQVSVNLGADVASSTAEREAASQSLSKATGKDAVRGDRAQGEGEVEGSLYDEGNEVEEFDRPDDPIMRMLLEELELEQEEERKREVEDRERGKNDEMGGGAPLDTVAAKSAVVGDRGSERACNNAEGDDWSGQEETAREEGLSLVGAGLATGSEGEKHRGGSSSHQAAQEEEPKELGVEDSEPVVTKAGESEGEEERARGSMQEEAGEKTRGKEPSVLEVLHVHREVEAKKESEEAGEEKWEDQVEEGGKDGIKEVGEDRGEEEGGERSPRGPRGGGMDTSKKTPGGGGGRYEGSDPSVPEVIESKRKNKGREEIEGNNGPEEMEGNEGHEEIEGNDGEEGHHPPSDSNATEEGEVKSEGSGPSIEGVRVDEGKGRTEGERTMDGTETINTQDGRDEVQGGGEEGSSQTGSDNGVAGKESKSDGQEGAEHAVAACEEDVEMEKEGEEIFLGSQQSLAESGPLTVSDMLREEGVGDIQLVITAADSTDAETAAVARDGRSGAGTAGAGVPASHVYFSSMDELFSHVMTCELESREATPPATPELPRGEAQPAELAHRGGPHVKEAAEEAAIPADSLNARLDAQRAHHSSQTAAPASQSSPLPDAAVCRVLADMAAAWAAAAQAWAFSAQAASAAATSNAVIRLPQAGDEEGDNSHDSEGEGGNDGSEDTAGGSGSEDDAGGDGGEDATGGDGSEDAAANDGSEDVSGENSSKDAAGGDGISQDGQRLFASGTVSPSLSKYPHSSQCQEGKEMDEDTHTVNVILPDGLASRENGAALKGSNSPMEKVLRRPKMVKRCILVDEACNTAHAHRSRDRRGSLNAAVRDPHATSDVDSETMNKFKEMLRCSKKRKALCMLDDIAPRRSKRLRQPPRDHWTEHSTHDDCEWWKQKKYMLD